MESVKLKYLKTDVVLSPKGMPSRLLLVSLGTLNFVLYVEHRLESMN